MTWKVGSSPGLLFFVQLESVMSKPVYAVNDTVLLKSGVFRKAENDRTCRIASVLPDVHGSVQYRVRFGDEGFERRVFEDDIDRVDSPPSEKMERPVSSVATSSWVNPQAIKIKR